MGADNSPVLWSVSVLQSTALLVRINVRIRNHNFSFRPSLAHVCPVSKSWSEHQTMLTQRPDVSAGYRSAPVPAAKAAPQAVNKEAATISGASTVAKRIPAPQVPLWLRLLAACISFRPCLLIYLLNQAATNKCSAPWQTCLMCIPAWHFTDGGPEISHSSKSAEDLELQPNLRRS